MITLEMLTMGRDKTHADEFTGQIKSNLERMFRLLVQMETAYGQEFEGVTSGWRPPSINSKTPNAAKLSNHQKGLAVDIKDTSGKLTAWVIINLPLMKKLGLFIEDFRWTPGWVHVQGVQPASGRRIFIPYADQKKHPMTAPNAWSGRYDGKFDAA